MPRGIGYGKRRRRGGKSRRRSSFKRRKKRSYSRNGVVSKTRRLHQKIGYRM